MPDKDQLAIRFFLQLLTILIAARLVGKLGKKLGQPQVVGEMIAGVLLGPSLFAKIWPAGFAYIFPWGAKHVPGMTLDAASSQFAAASQTILYAGAQLGLALYMFVVGTEFKTELFTSKARSAAAISLSGMAAPFGLGALLCFWLHADTGRFFTPSVSFLEAAKFLGASMCITAFPMLARIIYERGLSGTALGTLSLAAGALDDAAAWCILAMVLAGFGGDPNIAWLAIGGGAVYAVLALTLGKRLFSPLGRKVEATGELSPDAFAIILIALMVGAWWTDFIKIYAVFGAFIMGIAMPRGKLTEILQNRMEPLVVTLLLPMFFTFSGLNTELGLVNSGYMWLVVLAAMAAAVLGKFGACWAAARLTGQDNSTALAIGTLMNARGLMELIILNIGLSNKLITKELFTVMVIMAIVTTLMASPMFEWLYGRKAKQAGTFAQIA
jgi:Kef-type K+ transport system membrane component KefB